MLLFRTQLASKPDPTRLYFLDLESALDAIFHMSHIKHNE